MLWREPRLHFENDFHIIEILIIALVRRVAVSAAKPSLREVGAVVGRFVGSLTRLTTPLQWEAICCSSTDKNLVVP